MSFVSRLDYSELISTRDYLQDMAKIIGKVQQLFLPSHPRDWHRGLIINKNGLSTQPFLVNSKSMAISLNFRNAQLEISEGPTLQLNVSAQNLLMQLSNWLKENGVTQPIPRPELITTKSVLDTQQANKLANVFDWVSDLLGTFKQNAPTANFSPILVYPHHFDISLVQLFDSNLEQLSFGFSTGDETIAEPYFYIIAYPEPQDSHQLNPPSPAYWQTEGFSGAVLRYRDLNTVDQPDEAALQYLNNVFNHYNTKTRDLKKRG